MPIPWANNAQPIPQKRGQARTLITSLHRRMAREEWRHQARAKRKKVA